MDQNQLEALIREVVAEVMGAKTGDVPAALVNDVGSTVKQAAAQSQTVIDEIPDDELVDICSHEVRQRILIAHPMDTEMMDRMRRFCLSGLCL